MRLFIRTEASSQIGMGHFMRCFAIAEEARRQKIPVTFLLNHVDETIRNRCQPLGIITEPVSDFGSDVASMRSVIMAHEWVLVDSYKATADYLSSLRRFARLAVIDDLDALAHFDCDLLINPAIAAPQDSYVKKTSARLLLGAKYALIRREFRKSNAPLILEPSIAIMFGGSDPTGLSGIVARQLHDLLPSRLIKVIAGPANLQAEVLTGMMSYLPRLRVLVSPHSVARALTKSELVITAAGGSVGEVAAMGLPALVLVVYDNQAAALKACPFPVIDARAGLPDDLGKRVKALMDDPAARADIARKGHAVVDGLGPKRIVEAMRHV